MRIHAVDFEGSLKYGVVEYGIVTIENSQVTHAVTGLCRPERAMDPRDIQVHGLKDARLAHEPSFVEKRNLFHDLRESGVMAAHHASVENGFLNSYWNVVPCNAITNHPAPSNGSWGPWVDSRVVYQHYYDLEDYSLMNLIRLFQLETVLEADASKYCPSDRCKPHCALFDTLASAHLIMAAQGRFGLSVSDLIRISQPKRAGDFAQPDLL